MSVPISMTVIWIIAAVVFFVVEMVTVALCSIWFCAGCVCAIPAAALGAPVWLQLLIFAAVSIGFFILLYPRLKDKVNRTRSATNADRLLGQQCTVTQQIDALAGTGAVVINGQTWMARTENDTRIPEGTHVTVLRIEGAKLIVSDSAAENQNV